MTTDQEKKELTPRSDKGVIMDALIIYGLLMASIIGMTLLMKGGT
jgi:hypothetical protein